jgi:hypothetical protein
MPQSELRRRLKQRDTMQQMIVRAEEERDEPLKARRVKSLESIEEMVRQAQEAHDAADSGAYQQGGR